MLRKTADLVILISVMLTASGKNVDVPTVVVVGVGQDALFRCSSFNAVNIEWLINGTSLTSLPLSDVFQSFDSIASLGALRFHNVPVEYNGTIVQCIVITATSGIVQAPNSTLLVQGTLSAVGVLEVSSTNNFTVFLNWTAPFTLDFTFSPVDITYCVDVVSSTSSATLHSECGITETEFIYPLPPRSWCHEYNFTVTPVNVVGNGTTNSKSFSQDLIGSVIVEVEYVNTSISVIMSGPVCNAELMFEDIDVGHIITLEDTDLTTVGNKITFSSLLLTTNRKYRVRALASQTVSDTVISTHDIINCSAILNADSITVLVNFTEHSEATGALLSFIFIEEVNIVDFSKSFILVIEKNSVSQGLVLPLYMLSSGQYMLYAYDIESNKAIMDRLQYQASNSSFRVNGQAEVIPSPSNLECSITSHERIISVVFPFSRFQVTAQRNALDSVNVLHVNTSMDPQTPVTLQVTENGEYLVTILPVQDGRGILSGLVFSQIHTVTDDFTTTQVTTTSIQSLTELTITGLIGGLVCLSLLSAVLAVVVIILCCKQSLKVKVQLPAEVGGALSPDDETAETQMYEEIKEPASAPPTQRPANPAPRVPPPALVPQYEDVEISAASNTKHSYQITTCAAYGVSLNSS